MSSGESGGDTSDANPAAVTAGVVAGIIICSILFLIVLALVAYNIYLWRRRQAGARAYRERQINKKSDCGWRPTDVLYSSKDERFKGSGTINPAFTSSTAGSVASVNSKATGPAPKAQTEDLTVNGDVSTSPYKPPRPTMQIKDPTQKFSSSPYKSSNAPASQNKDEPRGRSQEKKSYPYKLPTPRKSNPPEVTLQPQHLQAKYDPGAPSTPPYVPTGQNYRASPDKMPYGGYNNNCFTVLSAADKTQRRTSDISLTGFGAQDIPGFSINKMPAM